MEYKEKIEDYKKRLKDLKQLDYDLSFTGQEDSETALCRISNELKKANLLKELELEIILEDLSNELDEMDQFEE